MVLIVRVVSSDLANDVMSPFSRVVVVVLAVGKVVCLGFVGVVDVFWVVPVAMVLFSVVWVAMVLVCVVWGVVSAVVPLSSDSRDSSKSRNQSVFHFK